MTQAIGESYSVDQLKSELAQVNEDLNNFILDNFEVCWSTDYAAVELRVIASVTEDPVMVDAYRNGKDLHYLTASKMFNKLIPTTEEQKEEAETNWRVSKYLSKLERLCGKKSNFTIIYGSGNFTLLQFFVWFLPNATPEDMGRFREAYFETYPAAAKYVKRAFELFNKGKPQPRTLWMPDGRKITVTNVVMAPAITLIGRKIQVKGPNQLLSYPIQGSAADAFKLAVCHMRHRAETEGIRLECCNQVHDDLIARSNLRDFNRAAQLFRDGMEWSINYVCKRLFYTPVEQDFLILSCCGTTFGEYEGNGHNWSKWKKDLMGLLHHHEKRIANDPLLQDIVICNDEDESDTSAEVFEKAEKADSKEDLGLDDLEMATEES